MSDIQSISQGNYILHNIDAKKLYVQEPLFTANSGDAVYVGWRPDETVLWSGSLTSTFSLSESMSAFDRVRFVMHCDNGDNQMNQNLIHEVMWNNGNIITMADVIRYPSTSNYPIYDYRWGAEIASNGKDISNVYHEMYWHAKNSWTGGGLNENAAYYPVKIIGINRKENA